MAPFLSLNLVYCMQKNLLCNKVAANNKLTIVPRYCKKSAELSCSKPNRQICALSGEYLSPLNKDQLSFTVCFIFTAFHSEVENSQTSLIHKQTKMNKLWSRHFIKLYRVKRLWEIRSSSGSEPIHQKTEEVKASRLGSWGGAAVEVPLQNLECVCHKDNDCPPLG